jgi:hypothetical protein
MRPQIIPWIQNIFSEYTLFNYRRNNGFPPATKFSRQESSKDTVSQFHKIKNYMPENISAIQRLF